MKCDVNPPLPPLGTDKIGMLSRKQLLEELNRLETP